MLVRCPGRLIEKRRHISTLSGGEWVIDEFAGRHAGLIMLEVELPSASAARPAGLAGRRGHRQAEYYNSRLAMLPGGEI